jgi:hypothetical protein
MPAAPSVPYAVICPPWMVIMPLSFLLLPPMPAAYFPPVAVSAPASSPGALLMESVRPPATSRPARLSPERSALLPARKSETQALVSSVKAHWPLLPSASITRFESVTSHVTPCWTTTRTWLVLLVPEIVKGPAFVSVMWGA